MPDATSENMTALGRTITASGKFLSYLQAPLGYKELAILEFNAKWPEQEAHASSTAAASVPMDVESPQGSIPRATACGSSSATGVTIPPPPPPPLESIDDEERRKLDEQVLPDDEDGHPAQP